MGKRTANVQDMDLVAEALKSQGMGISWTACHIRRMEPLCIQIKHLDGLDFPGLDLAADQGNPARQLSESNFMT